MILFKKRIINLFFFPFPEFQRKINVFFIILTQFWVILLQVIKMHIIHVLWSF